MCWQLRGICIPMRRQQPRQYRHWLYILHHYLKKYLSVNSGINLVDDSGRSAVLSGCSCFLTNTNFCHNKNSRKPITRCWINTHVTIVHLYFHISYHMSVVAYLGRHCLSRYVFYNYNTVTPNFHIHTCLLMETKYN